MIEQRFNKATTIYEEITQLKSDIEKCENQKSKEVLTKRKEELKLEWIWLNRENIENTDLLNTINKKDKMMEFFEKKTLKQRYDYFSKKYKDIEIDLVFKNKLDE